MPRLARSLALALLIAAPLPALAQDATGLWRSEATEEGTIEVKIAPCGTALCGTILRARDLAGAEQPYPHSGKQMIWDIVSDGPGQWSDGQIWDPRNDRPSPPRWSFRAIGSLSRAVFWAFAKGKTGSG